ncbi:hypothetical protein [Salinimicrobium oceani]|uniref:DUF4890 domain-containing protein n=1 Tax=Salinimicrobium oceani TaxID=2722702 RepID=A0ABX1CZK7_9FLAO|nr:hypothetical protein [Salinimicrobium oceani]NJW52547.1 hypothetical protein [Salinimicrobium oceani]
MKTRTLFTFITFFSIVLLFSSPAVSQTMMQPEPSQELEKAAKETTQKWENELSLSAKQMSLMEKKFVEFAIKRNRILQSKMREEVKTKHLLELEVLENREMRDILTKPQYDRYIMLKRNWEKERSAQQNKQKP